MDVSIIIVNYNTYKYTSKCIKTVIEFTKGVSYEIILVDNASTECPADNFKQEFPSIELIKSPVNTGFTGGNNLGIEKAKGDYILLLNSDVELTADSISDCVKILKQNEKIGVISCKLLYPDGTIQKQCQRFPSVKRTWIELFRLHKFIPQPKRGLIMQGAFFDHLSSIYTDSVWGTFFMFPKKMLRLFEGNKLPEGFFMYAEDLLWCYSINKLGYSVYYNANTSVIHHSAASSMKSIAKSRHKNEYDIIVKFRGKIYAKVLVFLRGLLYLTQGAGNDYSSQISAICFRLFFKGKAE